jgi:H+/Cl- antiporter ClcA
MTTGHPAARNAVPYSLTQPGAPKFWGAVVIIAVGTGLSAAILTAIVIAVQNLLWPDAHHSILDAARSVSASHHIAILLAAGALTGLGQLVLVRLTSGNGIDITEAIWFTAGRLPKFRTLGSALLSVVLVGMGVSLGREGAPKQFGAVIADTVSDAANLPDEQRRLLVACGAGAGMAAAYGVPLGGALFALEVLRGALSLRLVLPAILTALIATLVSWILLPDAPTYIMPAYPSSASVVVWAALAGPIIGVVSVLYVRLISFADKNRPEGIGRLFVPLLALGAFGIISVPFPQLLGNGKDVAQVAFLGGLGPWLMLALVFLKPLSTALCLGCGAPGGLFTPSLSLGALLGALLGSGWTMIWPGVPAGLFALIGAGAVLAATTQGPVSATVLILELTGLDRSFIVPLLLAIVTATLVARTIEPRSIYEARLSEGQVEARRRVRDSLPS